MNCYCIEANLFDVLVLTEKHFTIKIQKGLSLKAFSKEILLSLMVHIHDHFSFTSFSKIKFDRIYNKNDHSRKIIEYRNTLPSFYHYFIK